MSRFSSWYGLPATAGRSVAHETRAAIEITRPHDAFAHLTGFPFVLRASALEPYTSSSALKMVFAIPPIQTRSPTQVQRTMPVRFETWRPTIFVLPRIDPQ